MSHNHLKRDDAEAKTACLVEAVATAMHGNPLLEAVKINRSEKSISIATLGRPDDLTLKEKLGAEIGRIRSSTAKPRCNLLEGKTDCEACEVPHDSESRKHITVTHDAQTTTIARVTCPTAPKFWRWRDMPWPKMVPRELILPEDDEHEDEWKLQLVAAGLCGLFGILGAFLPDGWPSHLMYFVGFVAGAWFIWHEVWERLVERIVDVHFLMLAVAVGSISIGAWGEGVMLLFLFSLSGALEHYAMGRTHREIKSLFKTAPKTAVVLDKDGAEKPIPVEEVTTGMKIRIKPGEQFPVDAEVTFGQTASDESNLTGEAAPVEKKVGDALLAGTMNLWGVVDAVVTRPASQSSLQQIITLIREAQHLKAPSQTFTDRFGSKYTYGILGLSAAMFFVWWLGFGYAPFHSVAGAKSAFYRAMTLLVVASPCALVLSIPSAILAAIAWAARRGILFRGGAAVEKLADITIVALDKTGTLTTGELQVATVESHPAGHEREIAELAFAMERLSTHPLARAITKHGKQTGLPVLLVDQFESTTGMGLRGTVQGKVVQLGRREWLAAGPFGSAIRAIPPAGPGLSEVWIAREGLVGRILLKDDIRPQARSVLAELHAEGIQSVVLTGDRRESAEQLKKDLGLDDVRAELKPEQKVEAIRNLSANNRRVAMVGDGVNDAPSLAAAYVGVAMGARGSDAALEQAEVVLMHDRLENFLTALRLSRRAKLIIKQNLIISLGTVVVLVGCALAGAIPLTLGVVGHEGSTVIVVMNSLRLLIGSSKPGIKEP